MRSQVSGLRFHQRFEDFTKLLRHLQDDFSWRCFRNKAIGVWKEITFDAFVLEAKRGEQLRIAGSGEKLLWLDNPHFGQ